MFSNRGGGLFIRMSFVFFIFICTTRELPNNFKTLVKKKNCHVLILSAPDTLALRPDGTLKEALELEWIHSPSAENKSLPPTLTDPVVNDIDGNNSDEPASPKGLKGKEPAIWVGGKRVAKPSARASESKKGHLDPKTKLFFSRFEGK